MKSFFAIVLLAVGLVAFTPIKSGYNVGDVVADFSLKNVDGKKVSLSSYKNNDGVIVVFDCNTCPYSKANNSRIIALNKKYHNTFPVVAINANDPEQSPGDSYDEMVAYAKAKVYSFPYLVDDTQEIAKAFGATNTPHVFVLTKSDSQYKVAYIGAIDDSPGNESRATKKYVEDAVNALLTGRTVSTTKTKAIGCGIKWK